MGTAASAVVTGFLAAVEARDPDAVAACFAETATYQNVPHLVQTGRPAIRRMFAAILDRADQVRWDILSRAESPGRVWLERVDRFWIGGCEHAIECNGIWEVDEEAGEISAVRDYLDLSVWHERLGDALG